MFKARPDAQLGALPPALGVADPAVQSWIDAMTAAWNERNGLSGPGGKQFLTRDQVLQTSFDAIAATFTPGIGGSVGVSDLAMQVDATIAALQDNVRKSLIFQALEQNIGAINTSAIEAQINAALDGSRAAIAQETLTRAQKDDALASAVNTIWASIGGASAVIQDGALAAVSPSGVSATKWTQVIAAVTDPNTGVVNSTSIKQDLNSYASAANGTFNSIYSVRAQIDVYGRTVVGGFGLSATSGAGSSGGGTIDFGVRADTFFIAATSSTPDAATQIGQGSSIPFMVLTYPQWVNGVVYPAGVYIKKAVIGEATIGTAQIGDAAITNAKIGDAQITTAKIGTAQITNALIADAQITRAKIGNAEIDTLKLDNETVMVPRSGANGGGTVASGGANLCSAPVPGGISKVFVTASVSVKSLGVGTSSNVTMSLYRDGTFLTLSYMTANDPDMVTGAVSWIDSTGAGGNYVLNVGSTGGFTFFNANIVALGCKR
jgi:hypothetical protein